MPDKSGENAVDVVGNRLGNVMPFETPIMATMTEHVRYNIVRNGLTDREITERLRRKGYKHPQRYLDRFKNGQALASQKLIWAVVELIEEQDRTSKVVN